MARKKKGEAETLNGSRPLPTLAKKTRGFEARRGFLTFWVDEREGWVCPGLGKRYNPRYLARLRKRHKGPLWAMLKG